MSHLYANLYLKPTEIYYLIVDYLNVLPASQQDIKYKYFANSNVYYKEICSIKCQSETI